VYQPRDYQIEAVAAGWRDLCSLPGNPVIVLPTGGGKSLINAELCKLARAAAGRVICLAHRKELLEQNAEKARALLPGESIGLYSAGLRRFNDSADIVFAGIQTVFKKAELFGERHLVLIDEVHLVADEGMYKTFLSDLRKYNPKLRMIGLTATPWRTGEGSICGADKLFQRVCHEVKVQPLIAQGYLSPLVSSPAENYVDTSGLHSRDGEFIPGEMEKLFDDQGKVTAACVEIANKTQGRNSVLLFCSGIGHAQHVAETLEEVTKEKVGVITGNTMPMERSALLSRFRAGELRFLCNVDVLTTGFDAPNIDAIGILRATKSPGLFVQICGRGFRRAPGKKDCLVLDFGENIKRHGPVDAVDYNTRKRGSFGDGEAPAKDCPNCEEKCPASVIFCEACGWKFPPRELKHDEKAATDAILSAPEKFTVEEVRLSRHKKRNAPAGAPDTLRVDYLCKGQGNIETTISEWVCLEHEGRVASRAWIWWKNRSKAHLRMDSPHGYTSAIDSAIDLWERGALASPHHLTAIREGKFWRITAVELDPIPEAWSVEKTEIDFETIGNVSGDELPF
jgi:DNA repair protein RadD